MLWWLRTIATTRTQERNTTPTANAMAIHILDAKDSRILHSSVHPLIPSHMPSLSDQTPLFFVYLQRCDVWKTVL